MRSKDVIGSAFAVLLLAGGATGVRAAENSEFQALARAKLSLTQAIERGERESDGKAIRAEFETDGSDRARYEVKILGRDKLVTYTLDADTGKVLETDNDRLEKLFTRLEPDDIRGAPTTLAQAIGVAEQRSGGKAIEAEVDRDSHAVSYGVTVAKSDGSERDLRVDGASGRVAEGR